jgi:hypothetical protein
MGSPLAVVIGVRTRMSPLRDRHWRSGAWFAVLAGVLGISLTVPLPSLPDNRRMTVMHQVHERLPGWSVERLDPSWEGAYAVVTECAGREVGFQFVPGHGLSPDDAWIQPTDPFSRERLLPLSDHWRHLVWYANPAMMNTLSCQEEIAQRGRQTSVEGSAFD